ncbi:MAG: zinc ribbon domain-containing protein [Candidatus Gorgyraea atricola]|nr:zinc ribbon domain-containing protein [Candidatus Gorgyraea atricola]
MPTYEYECQKCGKRFDFFQKMSDEPLSICPEQNCKGAVKRLLSAGAGFIFKGSGFYATDYRSKNYKEREKEEKPKSESPCQGCDKKESCKVDE